MFDSHRKYSIKESIDKIFVYLFVYTRKKNFENRTIPQPPYKGALSLFSLLFLVRFFRKLGSIYGFISLFLS